MEELEMLRVREMKKNAIVGAVLGVLGFYLALFEKKPFPVVLNSSFVNGEYNTVSASFYWGSIVVVAGCLMLVFALANLMTLFLNLRDRERPKLHLFVMVEQDYHKMMVPFLVFLLYMTTTESFEGVARIWTSLLHREWPVTEMYMGIRVCILILGIASATECIHSMLIRGYSSKWLAVLAVLFGIAGLIGLVATTYTNLWYLAEGLVAIVLYLGITYLMARLEEKRGQEAMEMLLQSDVLKELGL
ncbi:MAG: hypothetical protein IJF07_04865 [Lachnospiraceae bacterium]|nr:hypothetical protein [Lachnospiraceae bacterium]